MIGGTIGTVLCLAGFAWQSVSNEEPSLANLVPLALPPVFAALGGAVGGLVRRSEVAWQRVAVPPTPASPVARLPEAAAAPTVPSTSGFPTSVPLGALQARIGDKGVRVWLGKDRYEFRRALLEPAGVAFAQGDLRRSSNRALVADSQPRAATPTSPIVWGRIDRLDSQRTSVKEGAVYGGVTLTGLLVLDALARNLSLGRTGAAAAYGVALGGLTGAAAGHFIPHWHREWSRAATARPSM